MTSINSQQVSNLKFNYLLYGGRSSSSRILEDVKRYLINVMPSHGQEIQVSTKDAENDVISSLNNAFLDFECYPAKLVGILVGGTLIQAWIRDESHLDLFNEHVLRLLYLMRRTFLITFSEHEERYVGILANLMLEKLDTRFVKSLRFMNIQQHSQESLVQALYSIGHEVLPDPLLRNSHHVDELFSYGRFDLIAQHNENCLKSTKIVYEQRYLKQHLIQTPEIYHAWKTKRRRRSCL